MYRWLGARCINNPAPCPDVVLVSRQAAAGTRGRQASLSACDRRRRYRVASRHAGGVQLYITTRSHFLAAFPC